MFYSLFIIAGTFLTWYVGK